MNAQDQRRQHTQRRIVAVGAILLALAALYGVSMSSMGEDLVYYWSPTELVQAGDDAEGATVRLGGMVEPGTVDWNPEEQRLSFRITDGTESVAVIGKGAPPQMFREGIGAVVEGKLHADGLFHTDTVMVKHNNEYKAPEEGERPEEVYSSLLNEEGS